MRICTEAPAAASLDRPAGGNVMNATQARVRLAALTGAAMAELDPTLLFKAALLLAEPRGSEIFVRALAGLLALGPAKLAELVDESD